MSDNIRPDDLGAPTLNGVTPNVEKPLTPTTVDDQLRLRRIEDLQAEALAKANPLEANSGAANGALLRIGYRLEEAIEQALASVNNPLERFDRMVPAVDAYLKVMRQVDRFAQLNERLSARANGASTERR